MLWLSEPTIRDRISMGLALTVRDKNVTYELKFLSI